MNESDLNEIFGKNVILMIIASKAWRSNVRLLRYFISRNDNNKNLLIF